MKYWHYVYITMDHNLKCRPFGHLKWRYHLDLRQDPHITNCDIVFYLDSQYELSTASKQLSLLVVSAIVSMPFNPECQQLCLIFQHNKINDVFPLLSFVVIIQQYKYRDLTVREITNVISQYKDLKPVMDAYGKLNDNWSPVFDCVVLVIVCLCDFIYLSIYISHLFSLFTWVPLVF